MSTPTIGVHARARAIANRVRRAGTGNVMAQLVELAQRDPRRLAEITCELAVLATDEGTIPWIVGEREPGNHELRELVLRHAHTLYRRGVQTGWVMWGERLYQRDAKRRQRIDPAVAAGNSTQVAQDNIPLTARRRQVLALIAAGMSNDDIGRRLFLSAETVKTHLQRLYRIYGVNTRTALVTAAVRAGHVPCACQGTEEEASA